MRKFLLITIVCLLFVGCNVNVEKKNLVEPTASLTITTPSTKQYVEELTYDRVAQVSIETAEVFFEEIERAILHKIQNGYKIVEVVPLMYNGNVKRCIIIYEDDKNE